MGEKRVPRGVVVGLGIGAVLLGRSLIGRLGLAALTGEVALITGGSRGLGFLLARDFARQGCRVAICARDAAELDRAVDELHRLGLEARAYVCDVALREQVEDLIARVTGDFGRIDLLVNNAGVIQVAPVEELTLADFEAAMGIMFWGALYPTLVVLPGMLDRRSGRIVNITSIGGKVSVPHLLPYSCAKFAAVGLSEGLRAELADRGITVTTIVPGLMRTGSYLNALFAGRQADEFTWFSLGSSLPLLTIDAERAAAQIVEAVRRGDAERTLTVPAELLQLFHGVFPGQTNDLLGLANRFILPPPGGTRLQARGRAVAPRARGPLFETLTTLGRPAARRLGEYPPRSAQTRM